MTHNEMTQLRITAWDAVPFFFFGMPHTYLSTNKSKSSAFTQTSSLEPIQRKNCIQRLTCLLPAPLQTRHGPLWLLWDHTSRSSVQLQTLFVNAPTARNKYQQLVLNPLLQVQFTSQLYLLHNAAFTMRLKMFLAPQTNSTSESSTFQRVFPAYRSSSWQIPITAQIWS